MTIADASYWFDRPYHTVWFWFAKDRQPRGSKMQMERLRKRLALLERAVNAQKKLPVPIDLTQTERPTYIQKLRHDLEAGVP